MSCKICKFPNKIKLFKSISYCNSENSNLLYFAHLLLLEKEITWHTDEDKQYFVNVHTMLLWFVNIRNTSIVSWRLQNTLKPH